jgi:hypothetical protein
MRVRFPSSAPESECLLVFAKKLMSVESTLTLSLDGEALWALGIYALY